MKERNKRIILLISVCIITLFLLFFSLKINENRIINNKSISLVDGYLPQIKYEGITNQVQEQPNSVIYVSNSAEKKSHEFEKEFKKVLKSHNLSNDIIYININNVATPDQLYQNAPVFLFYKDGQINDMIDCNILKSEKEIIIALKERGVSFD